jgi:hypothetical protein
MWQIGTDFLEFASVLDLDLIHPATMGMVSE